jgi:hypothetical protein
MFADNGRGVVIGEIDCFNYAAFGAFFAVDALFFIEYHAAAGPCRQRTGRTGIHAGDIPRTGKAMCREKLAGNSAECSYFNRAFVIGKRFMVDGGAYPLAGKTPDAFIHID